MKKYNHQFSVETNSTQEREKRFTRKNNVSSSRSHSNCSPSSSISKLFVKNLNQKKIDNFEDLLRNSGSSSGNKSRWSPPLRQSTPSRTNFQKKMKMTQEQLLRDRQAEIERLKAENEKYRKYTKKQSQQMKEKEGKIKNLEVKMEQLEQVNLMKKEQVHEVNRKMNELEKTLLQKDNFIQLLQKQQSALKKVKGSIFQTRMEEFQLQKNQLNEKIFNLEAMLQEMKSSSSVSYSSWANHEDFEWKENLVECLKKSEEDAYKYREENNKLRIELNFQKRQFYKEMEVFREKKELEYFELKKKFTEFLSKYKVAMKKIASLQIHEIAKDKKSKKPILREKSLQSLSFSSFEEEKFT